MGMLMPAGGVAALALLFTVIGLAGPMASQETTDSTSNMTTTTTFGIRDMTTKFSTIEVTTNLWDIDCPDGADDCKKSQKTSQAGFAFCFMGMLVSLVFLAACFTQMIPLGAWMVGLVMFVFYLIGVLCAVTFPYNDKNKDVGVWTTGWGVGLLVTGLVFNVIAEILAFLGRNDAASADKASEGGDASAMPAV
jgi:hypothetical protein